MKPRLILISLVCLCFFAYKKTSTTNNPTTNTLLTKILVKWSGSSDSDQAVFTYDANNRLIKIIDSTSFSGSANIDTYILMRNAAEYVTSFTIDGNSNILSLDPSNHYIYKISIGSSTKDSVEYYYTGSNITIAIDFSFNPFPFALISRPIYTYDANGNLTICATDTTNDGGVTFTMRDRQTYTYDSKTSPLRLDNDRLILNPLSTSGNNETFIGPNNVIQVAYQDFITPANNFTTNYTYTYNVNNKPISATGARTPGGQVSTITYTY